MTQRNGWIERKGQDPVWVCPECGHQNDMDSIHCAFGCADVDRPRMDRPYTVAGNTWLSSQETMWVCSRCMSPNSHLDEQCKNGCPGSQQPPMANADTLDQVLAERGQRYGKFEDHADVTQTLYGNACRHAEAHGVELSRVHKEALHMILHKIGRIVNGDPNYADSWVDIAGYAQLVADQLEGRSR